MKCLLMVCLLVLARPLSAQDAPPPPSTTSPPGMMAIVVLSDRIMIGGQWVPRFLDLLLVKSVVDGELWELPADSTWDYVEVRAGGIASCNMFRSTTIRFTHFLVHPGGRLNCGNALQSLGPGFMVEFIVRDVPIDTARDPFQWGNGLLNFGRLDSFGSAKLEWTALTSGVTVGATSITLAADQVGWRIGDELLLPDSFASRRRESPVFIAGIAGRTITLSKPLDFAHPSITKPDGSVVLQPRVANVTRNIVVRSEGSGAFGHTANVGLAASWHVAYTEIRVGGRTRNVNLDSTSADGVTHIGTNQVGRYAVHEHFAQWYG